jgi:hypothetical protein
VNVFDDDRKDHQMRTFRFVNISSMLKSLLAIAAPERFENSTAMQRYLKDLTIHRKTFPQDGASLENFVDQQDFLYEWREPQDHPNLPEMKQENDEAETELSPEKARAIPLVVVDSYLHPRLGRTGWLLSSAVIRRLNDHVSDSRKMRRESEPQQEEESELGGNS